MQDLLKSFSEAKLSGYSSWTLEGILGQAENQTRISQFHLLVFLTALQDGNKSPVACFYCLNFYTSICLEMSCSHT